MNAFDIDSTPSRSGDNARRESANKTVFTEQPLHLVQRSEGNKSHRGDQAQARKQRSSAGEGGKPVSV